MVNSAHRWLTAIASDCGLFEWIRIPFGLRGAGLYFVRISESILQPVNQFTVLFIDDVSVFFND